MSDSQSNDVQDALDEVLDADIDPSDDIEITDTVAAVQDPEPTLDLVPRSRATAYLMMIPLALLLGLAGGYFVWGQPLIEAQAALAAQPEAIAQAVAIGVAEGLPETTGQAALDEAAIATAVADSFGKVLQQAAQPQQQQQQPERQQPQAIDFDLSNDPSIGPEDALITIVEFGEFQ